MLVVIFVLQKVIIILNVCFFVNMNTETGTENGI